MFTATMASSPICHTKWDYIVFVLQLVQLSWLCVHSVCIHQLMRPGH